MSYATVDKTANMFPTFVRGTAQQKPTDAQIQQYLDDVAAELDAVLQRRFSETITNPATGGTFPSWIASLSTDALNILEKINRYGGAAQLGVTLATMGVAGARDLAKYFGTEYERLKHDLDARDANGEPLRSGPYDHLFDTLARTETPRPALKGVAGGDQPPGQDVAQQGLSNAFGKFDKRGT